MDDADLIAKIGKKRYRRRQERDRYFTQAVDLSSIHSNMSTTEAGNKLAKEIHEEFLTCKICLEAYKSPKSLDCLHTFCEQCIESHVLSEYSYKKYSDYREFTCPLCRKRTQLPLGGVKKLPDNFLVSSLGEVVARQKPSKFPFCDICKLVNRKHREASSKCLDCNKLLCKGCVELHRQTKVTKNHSIFDCEIEKDIECKEHQEEVIRFFCEPCETCICVLCTFNEHKDHEITQFAQAVPKYKEDIQGLLTACKSKTEIYDRQLGVLSKCETVIKNTEQRIHEAAIQFIADVRSREKQLVDELHGLYGKEVMEHVQRKDEMQNKLDSLRNTCNLTELVLKGKDIELLLLKKQVLDKLSSLAIITLKDLPQSVHKHVAFVPGSVDLGELCDQSKAAALRSQHSLPAGTGHVAANGVHIRTSEAQTDMDCDSRSRMVSRYIQTQPHPRHTHQQQPPVENGVGGSPGLKSTVGTGTDLISTQEKGVSTRCQHADTSTDEGTTTATGTAPDLCSSPSARRARRRRERARQEMSAKSATAGSSSSATMVSAADGRGPVLSYSSSIDENHYG
ncbi:E3 ubiquitin-protein ligase TRIM45-like [Babylonia areolata]|uniref:E3 ubiquitin-protein ligase TRIM45-like n=1 Tax=Babylonia areolata TaxID=304850 RepID=UPI003FD37852